MHADTLAKTIVRLLNVCDTGSNEADSERYGMGDIMEQNSLERLVECSAVSKRRGAIIFMQTFLLYLHCSYDN